ncbi:MAG TPA: FAD-dependent monooxygenase, partial [Ktedonobacteraceae bacterium]|nr:FAD-dependent monooxygenase [Ktedonobacteraceae bacterium]
DILQSMHDPKEIFYDDIDQVLLDTWYRGRVALLGDAAHAVSPTAAMGGAMALEDAHVLAEELRLVDATQVKQALANYVARRKPRLAEIRQTSDFLVWLASVNRPALVFVRNAVMHLIPPALLLKGMEEILEKQA